jgi:taspase (threonine aspartase 1)
MKVIKDGGSATDATVAAIVFLEDCPYTNAGTGSNLTVQGTVECDASIMDGQSLQYGAVGAVSGKAALSLLLHHLLHGIFTGVKNPILVAKDLLCLQMKGEMSLGRVPPRYGDFGQHL